LARGSGCGLDGAWRSAEVCLQEIDGEVWPRCNFKPLVFSQFQTALDTLAERTRTMCLPRPDALRLAASRCRVGTAPCCIQWSRDNNLGTDHACHFLGQSHTTGKELAPPPRARPQPFPSLGLGPTAAQLASPGLRSRVPDLPRFREGCGRETNAYVLGKIWLEADRHHSA